MIDSYSILIFLCLFEQKSIDRVLVLGGAYAL